MNDSATPELRVRVDQLLADATEAEARAILDRIRTDDGGELPPAEAMTAVRSVPRY